MILKWHFTTTEKNSAMGRKSGGNVTTNIEFSFASHFGRITQAMSIRLLVKKEVIESFIHSGLYRFSYEGLYSM